MSSKTQATVHAIPQVVKVDTTKPIERRPAGRPRSTATATSRPVPKPLRTLAGLFLSLSDPRSLQILGSLSNGLPASLGSLTSELGIFTDEATTCLARLKSQRLVEGVRVEGEKGWSYRITEMGSATWGRAQAFGAAQS